MFRNNNFVIAVITTQNIGCDYLGLPNKQLKV